MLTQDVCEGEGHLALGGGFLGVFGKRKGGERSSGLGFANFGEVKVDESGLEAAVAEVGGDLPDVGAAFEEVGGVAVAQGVDDELGVLAIKTAFSFGEFVGSPGAGVGHGFAAVMEGLLERDAGGFPSATGGGKEPVGVAMPLPKGAEALVQFGGDWNVAFVSAFGVAPGDSEGEGLSVDVGGSDVEGFVESQTALVDGGEESPVATVAEGAKELADFLTCEDVREGFFAFDFDLTPDLPFEVEVITIEGAQGANGLVHGATREVSLGLKVEEEVEDLVAF